MGSVGMGREGTLEKQPVGSMVRSRRRALGLSQADLAGWADLHVVDVGLVERGELAPAGATVERLAAALGTEPALLAGVVPASPAP